MTGDVRAPGTKRHSGRNFDASPSIGTGMLLFQRLDVYRCSIELVTLANQVRLELPRGHAELADQLRRSAQSIPLNIAEGAGRVSRADKAKHFTIARG